MEPEIMNTSIWSGRLDICYILLSQGRPDMIWPHWFSLVCETGDLEILNLLLETAHNRTTFSEYDVNPWIKTACQKGFFSIVQCLLEHGYSNSVTSEHLRIAQSEGHEDIVGLLQPILAVRSQPMKSFQALQDDQVIGSNYALLDHQMQLMLREQHNKKRLMMAREKDEEEARLAKG